MDAEDESDVGELSLLAEPNQCACPSIICATAHAQGVTCQQIFERAFMRAGHEDSFARAVFVRFCTVSEREHLVPAIVQEYCQRAKKMSQNGRSKKGFCLGCMVNRKATYGLTFSYAMIHPEITDAYLAAQASKNANGKNGAAPETSTFSEVDNLLLDIIDSGSLDMEEGNWDALIRGEDSFD